MRVSPAARRSTAIHGAAISLGSLPRSHLSPHGEKVSAAAPVHPDSPVIEAPGLTLDTGRATALVSQSYAAAGICRAINPFAVIGGTGDGYPGRSARPSWAPRSPASPQVKIRPATAIHPDTLLAVAPGLSLDAGRAAALIDHLYSAAGVDPAQMPLHVVGGTGHLSSVLLSDSALGPSSRQSEGHSLDAQQQHKPHQFLHRQLSLIGFATSEARPRWNLVQAMI
jgi:hypothetical protein